MLLEKKNSKKNVNEINKYLKNQLPIKKYILVIVTIINVNIENQI